MTADEVFRAVITFPIQNAIHPYGAPSNPKVGDMFSFDMPGFVAEVGQADFDVRINKFSSQSRFMSVVTQEGHPLRGWRFWRVTEDGGDIVVETGAVDEANGRVARLKSKLVSRDIVFPPWAEMLENVRAASGGQRVVGGSDDHPEGDWVPARKDEFLSLVR
jgi:hypothetical protein